MEKSKRKRGEISLRTYWRIFLPLLIVLIVFLKFPLRIAYYDLVDDIVLYGALSLICMFSALRIYRRFHNEARRRTFIVLLCAILSGVHVFDLAILRAGTGGVYARPGTAYPEKPFYGFAWYVPRFSNDAIMCHSIYEEHWGTSLISIATKIKHTSWFACGG